MEEALTKSDGTLMDIDEALKKKNYTPRTTKSYRKEHKHQILFLRNRTNREKKQQIAEKIIAK